MVQLLFTSVCQVLFNTNSHLYLLISSFTLIGYYYRKEYISVLAFKSHGKESHAVTLRYGMVRFASRNAGLLRCSPGKFAKRTALILMVENLNKFAAVHWCILQDTAVFPLNYI